MPRYSVIRDDPGYRPDAGGGRYEVFCDGEKLHRVHTADEELGIAYGFAYNERGLIRRGNDLKGVTYRGRIEVRRSDAD